MLTSGWLPRETGRPAIFCMLIIHGFLRKTAGDASGPLFRPQFVPPSVAQRQGIAETLADALPGVEHGQVKLSLGRASRSVTPADSADLVIDFEILPPRKATAESIQLFFDRVEAKLILLSQGGVAASRLASSLVSRRISMGEPQQVAPPSAGPDGHARLLSEQPENVATPSSDAQKVQLPVLAGVFGLVALMAVGSESGFR